MDARRYIVLLSKMSIKKLLTITLSITFILLTGVTEEEAIELYMNKLQWFSVHIISKKQMFIVKKYYLEDSNKSPNLEERHIVRKAFNQQKKKLKKDWENYYKIPWPKIVISKEITFEAHHIIPINSGGKNCWWNITPLTTRNHKLLHETLEEKGCFSHNFIEKKIVRFILRIKMIIEPIFRKYTYRNNINYYRKQKLQIS